jgi:hypothetical protein
VSAVAPSGGPGMSAIPPLLEDKQTSGEGAKMTAHGPMATFGSAQKWSANWGRPEVTRRQSNRRRPRVARRFGRAGDERSCINVSGLGSERVVLRAIMDISARTFSLADRPRSGHSGHQCSHALGRPNLHLVSPLADLGWKLLIIRHRLLLKLLSSFVRARGRSFVPTLQNVDRVARRGGQGRPSRLACGWLRRCQAAP